MTTWHDTHRMLPAHWSQRILPSKRRSQEWARTLHEHLVQHFMPAAGVGFGSTSLRHQRACWVPWSFFCGLVGVSLLIAQSCTTRMISVVYSTTRLFIR